MARKITKRKMIMHPASLIKWEPFKSNLSFNKALKNRRNKRNKSFKTTNAL